MVLVVGGTGFVGRHLVHFLLAEGERVRILARRPWPTIPREAEFVPGDVTDPSTLPPAMSGVRAVFYLATIPKEKGTETFQRVNVEGTKNTLAAAKEAGARRFVYMSVLGAGPEPRFRYLYSKWQAEEAVRESGLDWTVVRASIIFGEGDEFVRKAARTVKNILEATFLPLDAPPSLWSRLLDWGRFIPLIPIPGSGQAKFQPIWVEDVARCLSQIVKEDRFIGQTVALGGSEYVTYEGLVDHAQMVFPGRRTKLHIPLPIVGFLATALPALGLNFPATREQVYLLTQDNITDRDSVERIFGFEPARLSEKIGYLREGV